jgi:hypothetical protein
MIDVTTGVTSTILLGWKMTFACAYRIIPTMRGTHPRSRRTIRGPDETQEIAFLFAGGIFVGFLHYGPSSLVQVHSTGDVFTTGLYDSGNRTCSTDFSRRAIAYRRSVLSNAEGITDPTIAGAGSDESLS